MRKDQRVTGNGTRSRDHLFRPGCHGVECFAVRAAVLKQLPAWPLAQDVRRAPAFIGAVIPLEQVFRGLRDLREPCELARLLRAYGGAGEYLSERVVSQSRNEAARIALTARRERNVRAPGVLAAERPLRLAVPDQINLGKRRAHAGTRVTAC